MGKFSVVIGILTAVGMGVLLLIVFLLLREKRKPGDLSEGAGAKTFPAKRSQNKNNGIIDYDIYTMTEREKLMYSAIAAAVIFGVGYLFYRSVILAVLLTPLSLLYPRLRTKEIISKRKQELNLQFKEGLYSLSSSLSAGKSIETAFRDALRDLTIEYSEPDTFIIREFEYITRKIEMNETVEAALRDFADRSHLEDIQNFVDVFETCKRTGGNLVQVMKNSTEIINDKIEIKQELTTMLSEKRFEQKVLSFMPIGIILLLSISAKDFMEPVFTKLQGRLVMTMAIGFFAAAYFISKKIMDIEV